MKLISLLEKIMPLKDSTIIKILSFLNNLTFVLGNLGFPIYMFMVANDEFGNSNTEKTEFFLVGVIIFVVLHFSYRFNKILLNKLR